MFSITSHPTQHFSELSARVMNDIFSESLLENITEYSSSETLEIVKMLDKLFSYDWKTSFYPEQLFDHQNNDHLRYFSIHHPECIEIVEFIREDPENKEANEILTDLAIIKMNDHSDYKTQRMNIRDFESLVEDYNINNNLDDLQSAVDDALEKWESIFQVLDEKDKIKRKNEEKLLKDPMIVINEAKDLLIPNTAWRSRNLVKQYINDEGLVGDEAREITRVACTFD